MVVLAGVGWPPISWTWRSWPYTNKFGPWYLALTPLIFPFGRRWMETAEVKATSRLAASLAKATPSTRPGAPCVLGA